MSRAFTKESTDDLLAGELPERPVPAHPNYVTPRGLEQLQARARELQEIHEKLAVQTDEDSAAKQKLREVERDQRYFNSQLERAAVVSPAGQPRDEVHFGATVKIVDEESKEPLAINQSVALVLKILEAQEAEEAEGTAAE